MRFLFVALISGLFSWQIQASPYCEESTKTCRGFEDYQPIICTPLLGDRANLKLGPTKSLFVNWNKRTFIVPSFEAGSVAFTKDELTPWGSMPGVGTLTDGTWVLVDTAEDYKFTCRISSVSETLPGFTGVSAGLPDVRY